MEKFNQHSALAEPENPDFDGIKMDGCDGANRQQSSEGFTANLKYLLVGVIFGIVFVKAEIVSWFRIQEMFRLDSFHMYGVIGSAVVVGLLSVWLIKKFNIKTLSGEPVSIPDKAFDKGQIYGGLLFGVGWAITGACPGPLFAQIGAGYLAVAVTLLSAIAGTWVYGLFRSRLPHGSLFAGHKVKLLVAEHERIGFEIAECAYHGQSCQFEHISNFTKRINMLAHAVGYFFGAGDECLFGFDVAAFRPVLVFGEVKDIFLHRHPVPRLEIGENAFGEIFGMDRHMSARFQCRCDLSDELLHFRPWEKAETVSKTICGIKLSFGQGIVQHIRADNLHRQFLPAADRL
jgi:uncharacterized membrane protein YedE/YeeE